MAFKIGSDTVITDNTEIIGKRINPQASIVNSYTYQTYNSGNRIVYYMNLSKGNHFVVDINDLPATDNLGNSLTYPIGNTTLITLYYFTDLDDNFSPSAAVGDLPDDVQNDEKGRADAYEFTVLWKKFNEDNAQTSIGSVSVGNYSAYTFEDGLTRPTESGMNIRKNTDVIFRFMKRPSNDTNPANLNQEYEYRTLGYVHMKDCF